MVDWALAQRVAVGALILKPAPATYRSSNLQGQFDDLTASTRDYISARPLAAVGVALAVGFLLGLSRRR